MRFCLFLASLACWAEPACTTTACTEWVRFDEGPWRSLIYRSHALDVRNERITRALIVIHGQGRNADDYFRTGLAAAFLADGLDNTVIIAPRFASKDGTGCNDSLAAGEVNFRCSGDSWRSGAWAINDEKVNSYTLVDEIVRRLARKATFPNLKTIVITGHSAGGQYVSRYVLAQHIKADGVDVRYVISNPSSYAYLSANRPGGQANEIRPYPDARNCTTYDDWPYGLNKRTGAASEFSAEDLIKRIASANVTFLLGELDTLPIAGFDSSCPAMAQGPNRFARGQAYAKYLKDHFSAHPDVKTVPLCGHNARCVYTSEPALSVLFPKN